MGKEAPEFLLSRRILPSPTASSVVVAFAFFFAKALARDTQSAQWLGFTLWSKLLSSLPAVFRLVLPLAETCSPVGASCFSSPVSHADAQQQFLPDQAVEGRQTIRRKFGKFHDQMPWDSLAGACSMVEKES